MKEEGTNNLMNEQWIKIMKREITKKTEGMNKGKGRKIQTKCE